MHSSGHYPQHGGQLQSISNRFGIPVSCLLDFSANINPDGPPASVLSALRASLEEIETITAYPDLDSTNLKEAIANYSEVLPGNIIVANGFVPLLEAALRAFSIRRCLLVVPAFVEYRRTLERLGVEIEIEVASAERSFEYDVNRMLDRGCDAILLANPQNPSGICQHPSFFERLVEEASKRNIYILLDEAFIDYVPELSLTAKAQRSANLIVFRSVTKFHGIPGLRVAYAVAHPSLATSISEALPPWPITTLASRAVIAALDDHPYALRTRSNNLERRRTLERNLRRLSLPIYPAAANFLLFRIPPEIDAFAFWQLMITEHRVVLRSCADYEGLSEGHFRVAIKTPTENNQLTVAIEKSLSELNHSSS
ncbi:pyridoxal phosphate-dependent aminotransferase [Terriglobus albidus]|uniref:pyridoxal phosphate-dependent aminotransferase n=1 Tax=Terriglobus albidus TaxID=1592106 RepID=UPI0021E0BE65|nr:aminotransferase class I/II-fold pyridoxal phosphate-dependent enzyme [Terriglobus albidus]